MRTFTQVTLGIMGALLVAGCRTATRVTEAPRVDLDLEGGNRGYLIGKPPSEAVELKTTRQMIQTDVEIPSLYTPRHAPAKPGVEGAAPTEAETGAAGASAPSRGAPETHDTYVVQKGDSLWSIAAKPEIYGKATRWRRIFDANREVLKSPEGVRPGMTLKIPRGDHGHGSTAYGEEGTTFKK